MWCMCTQYSGATLLRMWNARASPVIARMVRHGHRVDLVRLAKVAGLVTRVELGSDDCFSDEVRRAGYSHHLKGCKWREPVVQEA